MYELGSITEDIQAKIQSRVAILLSLREPLLKLNKDKRPKISQRSKALLVEQERLEKELPKVTAELEKSKVKGGWSFITGFYPAMNKHIDNANQLIKDSGGVPKNGNGAIFNINPLWLLGIAVITFVMVRRK